MNNACRTTESTKRDKDYQIWTSGTRQQYMVELIQSRIGTHHEQKEGLENKNTCACNAQSMIQIIISPCSHSQPIIFIKKLMMASLGAFLSSFIWLILMLFKIFPFFEPLTLWKTNQSETSISTCCVHVRVYTSYLSNLETQLTSETTENYKIN